MPIDSSPPTDSRNFATGQELPSVFYVDQPYTVVMPDGTWVCLLTTGQDREGESGQFVAATRSADQGKTWSELVPIESPTGPAASWAVPLLTPSGRIYAFYTYNGDPVHAGEGEDEKWHFWQNTPPVKIVRERNDLHGWYVYKFSDDGGQTWSPDRYRLPMRQTACDQNRTADTNSLVQLFWGIARPVVTNGNVLIPFTKMGRHFQQEGEGWLMSSDNILSEQDPTKIRWQMLPEGDTGSRHPQFGAVQEEHNVVPLDGNKSLFCIYRTEMGFPACSYSYDRGKKWTPPEPLRYDPGGPIMRTPRACPTVWKCQNGKYLFWFHCNGYPYYQHSEAPISRNLVWLSGGVERAGKIHWSQPELINYEDNTWRGSSYPDLIEDQGDYYLSSTQKVAARCQLIDKELLEEMWNQDKLHTVTREGLLLELDHQQCAAGQTWHFGSLPRLDQPGAFTIALWVRLNELRPGQVLLDSTGGLQQGIRVTTGPDGSLEINFHDGKLGFSWASDPGALGQQSKHHVAFVVDGGPKCASVIVDGRLCDGGDSDQRRYGYGRFGQTGYFDNYDNRCERAVEIGDVTGTGKLSVPAGDEVLQVRLYNRYLRTSEAIGNFRAGC